MRDKCVESCDPGIALQKIKCILIYNYRTLHVLDKTIWNIEKTSRDLLSHVCVHNLKLLGMSSDHVYQHIGIDTLRSTKEIKKYKNYLA
jgi:hypothetical protein